MRGNGRVARMSTIVVDTILVKERALMAEIDRQGNTKKE